MSDIVSIRELIVSEYNPKRLEFVDNSTSHAGHDGAAGSESEVTHLKIIISSDDIKGSTRLEKHRNINRLLDYYFKKIHSIEISLV